MAKRKSKADTAQALPYNEILQSNATGEKRPPASLTDYPELEDVLPDLAIEYRAISDTIAPLEKRKKELAGEINALLDAVGERAIRGPGWTAFYVDGGVTEKITAEKLLERGVAMEDIIAATERTPKAGYVQVRETK